MRIVRCRRRRNIRTSLFCAYIIVTLTRIIETLLAAFYQWIARLIAIVLGMNRALLIDAVRITIAGELSLINRQWCRTRHLATVPVIPSGSTGFPFTPPMLAPTRWGIASPCAEIHG